MIPFLIVLNHWWLIKAGHPEGLIISRYVPSILMCLLLEVKPKALRHPGRPGRYDPPFGPGEAQWSVRDGQFSLNSKRMPTVMNALKAVVYA